MQVISDTIELNQPVVSACLTQPCGHTVQLTQSSDHTLHVPTPLPPNGVYTLITKTDCGCFYSTVYLRSCERPSLPSKRPDLTQPTIIECCP